MVQAEQYQQKPSLARSLKRKPEINQEIENTASITRTPNNPLN